MLVATFKVPVATCGRMATRLDTAGLYKQWHQLQYCFQVGVCSYAPADRARTLIETATCLQCAKCLLYHCMSDTEGNYVHPCECSNSDGHWARRWIGLSLLSILVPCLCCYVPLMACYKCGATCNLCGGRHEAQWRRITDLWKIESVSSAVKKFIRSTVSFTDLDFRYRDDYFWVNFDHFWSELHFLRQLRQ
jgi:hypothetical protein